MAFTQGRGTTLFAAVDHGAEITEVNFEFSKEVVDIPATFGTDDADIETGATERNLTLTFLTAFSATSFHELLRAGYEGSGEVAFNILLEPGVVGTSNPRRTGTILINSLETVGEVGALRTQSQTYRIKPGTYVKASV